MIANSRCIACILSKQERKIRKNSDEQKKKEYIHKVLKILYEYGTKECAPMVEKRIKDIYKEYYEEDVDYVALKHRYNQYMLEKEEEIRAHIQKNNDIETCIKLSVPEIILILEWQIKLMISYCRDFWIK